MLRIDPSDAIPIWRQIEGGIRHLVASGTLTPGDAVLSVREMARELRVNPLTVSKAYRRLADLGVLVVRRGEGTFVSHDPPQIDVRTRTRRLEEAALRFASFAKTLGVTEEESVQAVRVARETLDRQAARKGMSSAGSDQGDENA